jgi:hypothetical protein
MNSTAAAAAAKKTSPIFTINEKRLTSQIQWQNKIFAITKFRDQNKTVRRSRRTLNY